MLGGFKREVAGPMGRRGDGGKARGGRGERRGSDEVGESPIGGETALRMGAGGGEREHGAERGARRGGGLPPSVYPSVAP